MAVVGAWMAAMVGLGLAARAGHRWAFLAGMILYGADMIAPHGTFSLGRSASMPFSY